MALLKLSLFAQLNELLSSLPIVIQLFHNLQLSSRVACLRNARGFACTDHFHSGIKCYSAVGAEKELLDYTLQVYYN